MISVINCVALWPRPYSFVNHFLHHNIHFLKRNQVMQLFQAPGCFKIFSWSFLLLNTTFQVYKCDHLVSCQFFWQPLHIWSFLYVVPLLLLKWVDPSFWGVKSLLHFILGCLPRSGDCIFFVLHLVKARHCKCYTLIKVVVVWAQDVHANKYMMLHSLHKCFHNLFIYSAMVSS